MKWSVRVARIRGVPLRIHWSFLVLFALIGLGMWLTGASRGAVLYVIGLVIVIFLFVLVHELAHVATARHYGVQTRSITLHPLGGVSMLERVPERPGQEAMVGLAGPMVNVVFALALLPVALHLYGLDGVLRAPELLEPADWVMDLVWINVLLGVFNLIPAFPLDGGRVLRATLAMRVSYAKATRAAAFLGRTIAIAFVVIGLFLNFFLVLVGIFIFFGAAMEERSAQLMRLFSKKRVEEAMRTDVATVSPYDSWETVVRRRDAQPREARLPLVVVHGGRLQGVVDHETLRYLQPRRDRNVQSVMRTDVPTVERHEDLSHVLRQFASGYHEAVPVVERDGAPGVEDRPRFVGLVSALEMEAAFRELRQEALARRAARRGRRRGAAPQATGARVVRGAGEPEAEPWVPQPGHRVKQK